MIGYPEHWHTYSVISLPSSVIYFGGGNWNDLMTDEVVEYKNQEWKLLGNLVRPRYAHNSIKMGPTIYIFGPWAESPGDGSGNPT